MFPGFGSPQSVTKAEKRQGKKKAKKQGDHLLSSLLFTNHSVSLISIMDAAWALST